MLASDAMQLPVRRRASCVVRADVASQLPNPAVDVIASRTAICALVRCAPLPPPPPTKRTDCDAQLTDATVVCIGSHLSNELGIDFGASAAVRRRADASLSRR